MPDVLISEDLRGVAIDELKSTFDVVHDATLWQRPAALLAMLGDFRALIVRNQTRVTDEVIRAGKTLQVVARAGVGLDNIDVEAARTAQVTVVYTPEQNSLSVAELTLGLMLSLARKIHAADVSTKSGGWERQLYTGTELFEKTLGLVGLGRIGFRVGLRAKAFGMHVIAHDEFIHCDSTGVSELGAELVPLDELLKRADFVSLHVPLTDQTRRLFDYSLLSCMQSTAFLINTSRGEVIVEPHLVRALQESKLAGAALDVREVEPPIRSSLTTMANVILTPHVAAFTVEGQRRVLASVCADVAAVLRGKPPKYPAC